MRTARQRDEDSEERDEDSKAEGRGQRGRGTRTERQRDEDREAEGPGQQGRGTGTARQRDEDSEAEGQGDEERDKDGEERDEGTEDGTAQGRRLDGVFATRAWCRAGGAGDRGRWRARRRGRSSRTDSDSFTTRPLCDSALKPQLTWREERTGRKRPRRNEGAGGGCDAVPGSVPAWPATGQTV